jgi:hypothetical protein
VRRGRAFRSGILPVRKGADIHVDSPAGLSSTTHRLTRGLKIWSNGNGNENRNRTSKACCRVRRDESLLLARLSALRLIYQSPLQRRSGVGKPAG